MENITNANDAHTKGVCKDFKIKKLGKYLDLHIQSELYCQLIYLRTLEICILK